MAMVTVVMVVVSVLGEKVEALDGEVTPRTVVMAQVAVVATMMMMTMTLVRTMTGRHLVALPGVRMAVVQVGVRVDRVVVQVVQVEVRVDRVEALGETLCSRTSLTVWCTPRSVQMTLLSEGTRATQRLS